MLRVSELYLFCKMMAEQLNQKFAFNLFDNDDNKWFCLIHSSIIVT